MRNLLLAASALSLAMVAGTAGVEAAGPWVNVAVNAPWAEIDGSVDITAQRGGTIGHVGWHEGNQGRSRHNPIGEIETATVGAINEGLIAVGREGFEYDNLTAAVGAVGGYSSDFNYSHGGYSSDQFFGPYRSGHYSSLNDSEEGWFAAGGYLDAVSIEAEGVPSGIAVNAAVNLADIDASVTIAAESSGMFGSGGEIGNIGSISTTAVGAQNVGAIAVGVPGTLSALGLGDD